MIPFSFPAVSRFIVGILLPASQHYRQAYTKTIHIYLEKKKLSKNKQSKTLRILPISNHFGCHEARPPSRGRQPCKKQNPSVRCKPPQQLLAILFTHKTCILHTHQMRDLQTGSGTSNFEVHLCSISIPWLSQRH